MDASQHPRYADHYTGELFFLEGVEDDRVELRDVAGRRSHVSAASFERAYDALDVTTRAVGQGHELWLGDRFEGTLRRTGRTSFSLLVAGESHPVACRSVQHVIEALGLDPRGTRILGL